jgi:hypothetical protein
MHIHTGLSPLKYDATVGYSRSEDEEARMACILMGELLGNVFLEDRRHTI